MIRTDAFPRCRVFGADGLSRLTLGQAVAGEHAKGTVGVWFLAHAVLDLYADDWLDRELARPRERHHAEAWAVLDALLMLRADPPVLLEEAA